MPIGESLGGINLSGSHTFSLTATAEIGRRNVIFKAKRK